VRARSLICVIPTGSHHLDKGFKIKELSVSSYLPKKLKIKIRINELLGSGSLKKQVERTAGSGYFKNFKEPPGFVKNPQPRPNNFRRIDLTLSF
jgi:hypothetical protein